MYGSCGDQNFISRRGKGAVKVIFGPRRRNFLKTASTVIDEPHGELSHNGLEAPITNEAVVCSGNFFMRCAPLDVCVSHNFSRKLHAIPNFKEFSYGV